ncbi:MAG TPA: MlaD family protein [Kaistella chaponensis]|uniref:Phospholipid/cholesterol/gamma-HCH transport system substrate-binding protein n=1 Tax=Kaistella chaponensis TaxID=713588 RepID=A0A1N7L0P9_9FLAO|nr:MlaD family protein [Kaistella chaponensis]SIS67381.1 phospholipid/cholesterol/gamma-HCH transport system substrate-binding protein [Kaistella chaponensis]HPW88885.1 MlaD family protein [Kaistella chaponensis]HQC05771.1 MlaD family protein [Kaistella chaponensis]
MKFTKEIKAGLIALLAIIGFVILFQFMKGKSLFTTDNIFYAKFDNVEGLSASNPVSINGLKVGQVDKIIPQTEADGKIHFVVKVTVDDDFEFSKRSTLEIFEPGLMSGKQMRINLAYGNPMAKDGDTLKGAFTLSLMNNISSQVGPVKDQLQVVLRRVDSLTTNANEILNDQNKAEIKALLINLNKTVASFEGTSRQTNALLANSDPKIQKVLDNANLATISAKSAIDKYGKVAEQVDVKSLNNTIEKLSVTSDKLNSVISGVQNGEGSLGKLTKDEQLYNNLNTASDNLNKLIQDLKTNPKRYLNFSVFGKNTKD